MLEDWERVKNIRELKVKDLIEMFSLEDIVCICELARDNDDVFVVDPECDPDDETEPEIPDREEYITIVQNVNNRIYEEPMLVRKEEGSDIGWIETEYLG